MTYVRVATYRGAEAVEIDALMAGMQTQIDERLAADDTADVDEVLLLIDREGGRALGITFYETEEALQRGDEVLGRLPMSQAGGVRTDVQRYEVALRRRRA